MPQVKELVSLSVDSVHFSGKRVKFVFCITVMMQRPSFDLACCGGISYQAVRVFFLCLFTFFVHDGVFTGTDTPKLPSASPSTIRLYTTASREIYHWPLWPLWRFRETKITIRQ